MARAHLGSLRGAQMIHHHDLSGRQTGGQDLLHIDLKSGSIGGSLQHHAGPYPLSGQRGDQRQVFSAVSGNTAIGTLAFGRSGIERREGDIGATFIHHYDLVGI